MLNAFQYRRMAVIVLLVCAGFAWLFCRLFQIQIARHQELAAKAQQYTETTRVLEAWRGQIHDRNGKVLAISVPVKTVYADAALCSNRLEQVAQTCGPLLQIPPDVLAGRLRAGLQKAASRSAGPPRALLLEHDMPVAEWNAITSALDLETFGMDRPNPTAAERRALQMLRRKALFARDEQVRLYPYRECLSSLLGFVTPQTNGAGLKGVCGIEADLDRTLAGESGCCVSEQDIGGNELPARRQLYKPPGDGANVVLTIDVRLQQLLVQTLAAARSRYQARSASAVIMNPRTFEVLAMASLPGFDPQHPGSAPPDTWGNRVLCDRVEPGSTFKLVTLAAALDQGLMTLDSGIYCEQGRFVFNKVAVRDHAPYGLLTLREAFAKSSNIAFAKAALALGPDRLYRYMTNFGFGQRTGIALVRETPGRIEPAQSWSTMALTRAAFGQGVSVSQFQMAVAMCVIANGGRLMRPMLISRIETPQGRVLQRFQPQFIRCVVSPQTARLIIEALEAVVSPGGTGALAAMDQYTVVAKTGTAQKSDRHGYLKGRYYSSMVGFFPADSPQVVISIALDEPQNGYYAGAVIAPVFRSVAEQAAACLCVPPDKAIKNRGGSLMAQSRPAALQPVGVLPARSVGEIKPAGSALASLSRR